MKMWKAMYATLPAKWEVYSEGISRFKEHAMDCDMQSGWNVPGASFMMIPYVDGV
jgi:hypothetical protein